MKRMTSDTTSNNNIQFSSSRPPHLSAPLVQRQSVCAAEEREGVREGGGREGQAEGEGGDRGSETGGHGETGQGEQETRCKLRVLCWRFEPPPAELPW